MNILDIIILLSVFIPGIITGIKKGFIFQTVTLAALFLGVWGAFNLSDKIGGRIVPYFNGPEGLVRPASFIITFIVIYVVIYFAGILLKKLFKHVFGKGIDVGLGVILGVLKCIFIAGLLILAVNAINDILHFIPKDVTEGSKLYTFLLDFSNTVFPYVRKIFSLTP